MSKDIKIARLVIDQPEAAIALGYTHSEIEDCKRTVNEHYEALSHCVDIAFNLLDNPAFNDLLSEGERQFIINTKTK